MAADAKSLQCGQMQNQLFSKFPTALLRSGWGSLCQAQWVVMGQPWEGPRYLMFEDLGPGASIVCPLLSPGKALSSELMSYMPWCKEKVLRPSLLELIYHQSEYNANTGWSASLTRPSFNRLPMPLARCHIPCQCFKCLLLWTLLAFLLWILAKAHLSIRNLHLPSCCSIFFYIFEGVRHFWQWQEWQVNYVAAMKELGASMCFTWAPIYLPTSLNLITPKKGIASSKMPFTSLYELCEQPFPNAFMYLEHHSVFKLLSKWQNLQLSKQKSYMNVNMCKKTVETNMGLLCSGTGVELESTYAQSPQDLSAGL